MDKELPDGIWFRQKKDTIIIGTTVQRDRFDRIYLSFFTICWTSILLANLPEKHFFSSENWESVAIFIFLSSCALFLIVLTLIALFGYVEIRLSYDKGTIFSGFWKLGLTCKFAYSEVEFIAEEKSPWHDDNSTYLIKIVGKKTIKFGTHMTEERRHFIISMLENFIRDGNNMRKTLAPNYGKHLID